MTTGRAEGVVIHDQADVVSPRHQRNWHVEVWLRAMVGDMHLHLRYADIFAFQWLSN